VFLVLPLQAGEKKGSVPLEAPESLLCPGRKYKGKRDDRNPAPEERKAAAPAQVGGKGGGRRHVKGRKSVCLRRKRRKTGLPRG